MHTTAPDDHPFGPTPEPSALPPVEAVDLPTPAESSAEADAPPAPVRWMPPPRNPIGRPGDLAGDLTTALGRLRGLALTPEHQALVARELERERTAARDILRRLARERELPEDEDLRAVAFDDTAVETPALAALRAALAWRGGRRRGCVRVVGGPPGVGKTAALAHVALRFEGAALFVAAAEIGATPRSGWSEHAAKWSRWLAMPLLAIDDLGTESGDPEHVAALLTQRYDGGRVTLVTTNLTAGALAARYFTGEHRERLADRLSRAQGHAGEPSGLPWYVTATGESLRSPAARRALVGRAAACQGVPGEGGR